MVKHSNKAALAMARVTHATRAARGGTDIRCPLCGELARVGHFAWESLSVCAWIVTGAGSVLWIFHGVRVARTKLGPLRTLDCVCELVPAVLLWPLFLHRPDRVPCAREHRRRA